MSMRCSLNLLIVVLHLGLASLALANLIHVPRTTETKVNDTTWLNCSTDVSKSVHWSHGENYVYVGGSVVEPYVSRFSIDPNAVAGTYNLIMWSVKSSDAGVYKCQDDEGHGTAASAQLIVLENNPVCLTNINLSQFIGSNECGIEQDRIVLTCEMTYYGNVNPEMQWKKSGESNNITAGVEGKKSGNKWEYTLTMMAEDSFNNNAFVCETTRSAVEQYRCTTGPIKILHPECKKNSNVSMKSVDEKVVCPLNFFGHSCSYKWFNAENLIVSYNYTLKPDKVGKYRCEATCFSRNRTYTVYVTVIELSPVQEDAGGGQYLWILVLLGLLLVVLIGIIIFCFIRRRKMKSKKTINEPVSQSLLQSEDQHEGKPTSPKKEISTKRKEPDGNSDLTPIVIPDEDQSNSKEGGRTQLQTAASEHKQELSRGKQFILVDAKHIAQGTGIRGIGVFNNMIYILTNDPVTLERYESVGKSHRMINKWPLNYLKNPIDMAIGERSKSIYIIDHEEVFDINPNDVAFDGNKVGKWTTKGYSGNISVSKDGNIILTSRKSNTVIEYECDGNLKHTLTLPAVVEKLQCAVKLQHGKFLVAYQELGNANAHVVSLVEFPNYTNRKSEGRIMKSFGDSNSLPPDFGMLKETRYLVMIEDEQVFVLDKSGRVVLLNSDLNFTQIIQSKGLDFPVKMCFNEKNKRLYVAGNQVSVEKSTERNPGFLTFSEC